MIAEHKSEHTRLSNEGENRVFKVVGDNLHILQADSPETKKTDKSMYEELREKSMEANRLATRKLTLVLLTSFVFIAVEIAGGI